jgi:hypothetical protein
MYSQSTLFKKAIEYVKNQKYDDWMVLSAKHGLLHMNEVIEPYDETLNNMKVKERRNWAEGVVQSLEKLSLAEVHFYAGQKYREFLIPLLMERKIVCRVPLEGLGIGMQLKFYTDNNIKGSESLGNTK